MKRGTNGVAVHDVPDIPVSKVPTEVKVVWHVNPADLVVAPREEEARRKAPEAKFLYALSACLTLMVLWGIFRQVHYVVPKIFASATGGAAATLEDSFTLDRIDVDALQTVGDDIGGRRAGMHLLEVDAEEPFLVKVQSRRRAYHANPRRNSDERQQQQEGSGDTRWGKSGILHRKFST